MLFLLFAIIFGSLFAVVFKVCQNKDIDTAQVILFNYLTAMVFSAVPVLLSLCTGKADAGSCPLGLKSILLALLQGCFFYLGFFIMDRSTSRSGVALTTAAARASLIVPLVLSWLLFSQTEPSWLLVGMIIAAMLMMVLPAQSEKQDIAIQSAISEQSRRRKAMAALVAVFFTYGISDFLLKVVQSSVDTQAGLDVQKVFIFLSASAMSLAAALRSRFQWRNLLAGVALGLINTGCTSCMLLALGKISTSIYYPLYNIGIVVVATLVGVLFFKEKLKPLQIAGLVTAAAAIALSL